MWETIALLANFFLKDKVFSIYLSILTRLKSSDKLNLDIPLMQTRLATKQDVDILAALERQHLNDELMSNGVNLEGQAFNRNELTQLIDKHWIVVAEINGRIIGYVIAGRWSFFETWPIYRNLLKILNRINGDGPQLTVQNSCQYGPIWVDKAYRGQGVFEALVTRIYREVAPSFTYLVTFIADENERSLAAHTRKAKMQVADFFTFSDRDYYIMSVDIRSYALAHR